MNVGAEELSCCLHEAANSAAEEEILVEDTFSCGVHEDTNSVANWESMANDIFPG